MPVSSLGIVGAGQMGRGIAQVAAAAGLDVRVFDACDAATNQAIGQVRGIFGRLAAKGRMSSAGAASASDRLGKAASLAELAPCDLVIEAVVEDLRVKQSVLTALGDVVRTDAIVATNTSSLSVTALAAAVPSPDRFLGLHFFNPVPLMRLVEVVPGLATSGATVTAGRSVAEAMGHTAVVVADTPGFLVNHLGRAYVTEALRLLEERVADVAAIDTVLRDGAGFRMGPFELMDLTGLDVTHPATEAIYRGFYEDPRLRPSYIARNRVAAGRLGRKTGSGFYAEGPPGPDRALAGTPASPGPVAVCIERGEAGRLVTDALADAGVDICDTPVSDGAALLLAASTADDPTTVAVKQGLDPARLVVLDAAGLASPVWTMSGTIATRTARAAGLAAALSTADRTVLVCRESPGHIRTRMIAVIVNLACDIAAKGIAAPAEIDAAVRLALGYPHGPLGWGDRIGPDVILDVLAALQRRTGDPRYRPSPWLRRRVELRLPITHEEV